MDMDSAEDLKKKQDLSEKDRHDLWLKDLAMDPYVGEARHVLQDMTDAALNVPKGLPALANQGESKPPNIRVHGTP
jgi:hypothetical protein